MPADHAEQPTVLVTATAQLVTDPDSFAMTAQLSVRANDSGGAYAGLAQRFTTLDRAVLALGADALRIERGAVTSWGEVGRMQRWHAHRSLTITCTDPSRVTEVASTLGRVADVQIDGPHWRLDRTNPVHGRAQAEAVHAARQRAERYAVALGGALGSLIELRDGDGYGSGPMAAMEFRGKAESSGLESMDLSPVPQTVTASVQARWYLLLPE